MEKTMMDTMFEMPSNEEVNFCRVTKEAVEGDGLPLLIRSEEAGLPEKNHKTRRKNTETPEKAS